jgi:hypothetical protein
MCTLEVRMNILDPPECPFTDDRNTQQPVGLLVSSH